MRSLPKPLIGLLLGTVAFFAIWIVALKPSSSSSNGGSQGGVGQYQSAINKAHQAVTTSNQANAKLGAPTATTKAASTPTPTSQAKSVAAKPATKTKAATQPAPKPVAKPTTQSASAAAAAAAHTVATAIRAGKVVAVLFYNDAAADDRAVKSELATIPTHGGQVVKVAVPVSQLIQFSGLTQSVNIDTAPELVLIDRSRQATTLDGYADSVEIAQRIDDALAAK